MHETKNKVKRKVSLQNNKEFNEIQIIQKVEKETKEKEKGAEK